MKELDENNEDACQCEICEKFFHWETMFPNGDVTICAMCHMGFLIEVEMCPSFKLALKVLDDEEKLN